MKSNYLTQAAVMCGAVLAAAAANAVTPSTVGAGNKLFISGATATDVALATLFVRNGTVPVPAFCKAGTIDVYIETALYKDAKNRAFLCTLNQAVGTLAANTNVAVHKESNGGSADGTTVIADAGSRTFLNTTNDAAVAGCGAAVAVAANALGGGVVNNQALTLHPSCPSLATVRADVGVADVNPALFSAGTAAITGGQIARLTSDALYQPMFAPAVSLSLYRALQRASTPPLALDDTATNIPSLTSAQLRSIYNGSAPDWSLVTSLNGKPVNDPSFTNGVAVSSQIYVCRRGDESGTQAAFASYFLNERCTSNVPTFVLADNATCQQNGCTWAASFLTDVNFAGKGSGDVRNCLDARNDNDQFAVGILGSESKYDSLGSLGGSANAAAGTQAFRYVAIDGRKPRLEDVANGKYDFVEENVLNRRNAVFAGVPVISGPQVALADFIKSSFGNENLISTIIVPQAHGLTGGLAPALAPGVVANTPPVSTAGVQANPVSPLTKSLLGPVNDCGPAIAVAPTDP